MHMVLVIQGKTSTILFTLFQPLNNVSVFQPPHGPSTDGMAEPTGTLN